MITSFKRLLAKPREYLSGISGDSREVKAGFAFVAIKGINSDGHDFIDQAKGNGARLVIGERGGADIKVPDSREAFSLLASAWYDNPAKKLKIIGVTGTDGKTTTATLIYWILKSAGKKVGLVSTVSAKIGNRDYETGFHVTNPEPLALHKFLAKMVTQKCEYAVLEVTSHGLYQKRVFGIDFDIGVLTNITHEHLDYHKTFANYAEAKSRLFNHSKMSVLNKKYADDLRKYIDPQRKIVWYDGTTLKAGMREAALSRFREPYNLENAAAAIAAAGQIGITDADITAALKTFPGIEGRMEEVDSMKGIRIIIDFAHTPNALESVLTALRKQIPKGKKLIAVFGCAGERDVEKRPMMGAISSRLADVSVFTAEDPRKENVGKIISQMKSGVKNKKAVIYDIPDRTEAISFAINKLAGKGDVVVVCGKGHEKSMNFDGVEHPWSDKKAIEETLQPHIHFMGIGGSGVSGVASLASKMGYRVSGCDIEKQTAYRKGISLGHDRAHVGDADLVVVSPAIFYQNLNHPEVVEAKKQGKLLTWQEFLGKYLQKGKKVICITGTHGKSTTTAMAGKLLADAGLDPSVVMGAAMKEWKGNSRFGKGNYFVTEADEFNNNFLNYYPEIIILNNIEFDHPDYFKNEQQVFDSFSRFLGNLVGRKVLIYNKSSEGIKKLLGMADTDGISLTGYSPLPADLKFKLKVAGRHNVANALGVVELGRTIGIKDEVIKKSLEDFRGIERRMQLISGGGSIEVYDDYAHHPTAIAATLQAAREMHPKARIWAVDEAHGFARTAALLGSYKNAFDDADRVLIGPIFKARDKKTFGMSPKKIADASGHSDARAFADFTGLKNFLVKEVKKGDVILVMGAGKSYIWAREIAGLVSKKK